MMFVLNQISMKMVVSEFGIFKIFEDGFEVAFDTSKVFWYWNDIVKIEAFKIDLLTFDEIVMEFETTERQMTITESTNGWNDFITHLPKVFPSINPEWWPEVVQPSFAESRTIVYEKYQ